MDSPKTPVKKSTSQEALLKKLVDENKKLVEENKKLQRWVLRDKKTITQGAIDISDNSFNVFMYKYEENEPTKYSDCELYGSWDDWQTPYTFSVKDFISEGNTSWTLEIDEKYYSPGVNYYKIKKDGEWIEPSDCDLRVKDETGNWNNLLFIR